MIIIIIKLPNMMNLPFSMRESSLKERKEFYEDFIIAKSRNWIGRDVVYAMILGKHTNIFLDKYKEDKNKPLIIDNYSSLEEVKDKFLCFLPEGVYYDRNYYKDLSLCHTYDLKKAWNWHNFDGQELAFDLDPENVNCPVHGNLQKRMKEGRGLSFCRKAFELTKNNTIHLYENLTSTFTDIRIVFSGRGFHIHVFDDSARTLDKKERIELANRYKKYGIDKWITTGEMRLIRLPFSLNAISSRIAIPLKKSEIKDFNPETKALPDFITN